MKRFAFWLTLSVLLFLPILIIAQSKIARVQIHLDDTHTYQGLLSAGFDVDHGEIEADQFFYGDFLVSDVAKMEALGYHVSTIVPDVKAWVLEENASYFGQIDERSTFDCRTQRYPSRKPSHWDMGSMGGYFTYQEILAQLDAMATEYPNLITAKAPIAGYTTHENRSIFHLKISDNPQLDENEPEIFYNAVHHAREPNSVAQVLYYMWYLLEGYGNDPEVTYLVDNTEMYFVPVINPDGYLLNQATDPDGGGFWRKNLRNNGDGTQGVDLNRNYGFEWGYDDSGSSPNTDSDVYRGPSPFSEPETQAIAAFARAHEFKIALCSHTYSNLLIQPWGYSDTQTAESSTFDGLSELLILDNSYKAGTGLQTVGYTVNGNSDDWMYGDTTNNKVATYSFTPETGPTFYGFWPPASEIEELSRSMMSTNLRAAHALHSFGIAQYKGSTVLTDSNNDLAFTLKRYGLQDGNLSFNIQSLTTGVNVLSNATNHMLNPFETANTQANIQIDSNIVDRGQTIELVFGVNNGTFNYNDTLRLIYAPRAMSLFTNDGSSLNGFTGTPANTWGPSFINPNTGDASISESPIGNYQSNRRYTLVTQPMDLVDMEAAWLQFYLRYNIADENDFFQVRVRSLSTGTTTPMCGRKTNTGSSVNISNQPQGEPVYDGVELFWLQEFIDLSGFVDQTIILEFVLETDNIYNRDGINLDDFDVWGLPKEVVSSSEIYPKASPITLSPNPTSEQVTLKWSKGTKVQKVELFDLRGQSIQVFSIQPQQTSLIVPTVQLAAGHYVFRVWDEMGRFWAEKVSVVH